MRALHILAFAMSCAIFVGTARAQSAGGMGGATTPIRYTPVAFPQSIQLSDFTSVTVRLASYDANGHALTYRIADGPSLGSLNSFDAVMGTVEYTPPSGFSTTDSFSFLVSDGVLSSDTAAITIVAPQPTAGLSTSSLNLGSELSGVIKPGQVVTLNNNSVAILAISGIALSGANAGDFPLGGATTCPSAGLIQANQTCAIVIGFQPSGAGTRSAILTIVDNAPSSPQQVALSGVGTDYSVSSATGASTSASVNRGQTASYNLEINSIDAFAGPVDLSCTGAPVTVTCSPNVASISVNGTSAAFTISATTQSNSSQPTERVGQRPMFPNFVVMLSCETSVFVFSALLLLNKRRKPVFGLVLFAMALAFVLAGCSSGQKASQPALGSSGTATGSYPLTVNAMSLGQVRTLQLTLNVD